MNPYTISRLLRQTNPEVACHYSVINHHVDGLHYLCLHRSEDLTIKVYIMEEPANPNGLYLVNPHTHRYAFSTVVLNGALDHVLFDKVEGDDWEEFRYDPESRGKTLVQRCSLKSRKQVQGFRSAYWLEPESIHTLQIRKEQGPLILGLAQMRDTRTHSELYLPTDDHGHYLKPHSRTPTVNETRELIDMVLVYLMSHLPVTSKLVHSHPLPR